VIVAMLVGGTVGGLAGRLIEAAVLPGASSAVIALAVVGVALGIRSVARVIEEAHGPENER
jgi:hypothetical protein